MNESELLEGAFDIHIHARPDVVERAVDPPTLVRSAERAKMAGFLLKDHCTSTVGRAAVLNAAGGGTCRVFSAMALNPPTGGLNPVAAEAALRAGVDLISFPTYGAAHHIGIWGAGKPPTAFPLPRGFPGIRVIEDNGTPVPEALEIIELIAAHDAVLATGHISPAESLAVLTAARDIGVKRLLATHVSESVSDFSSDQMQAAIDLGAFLEHAFFAATSACPGAVTLEVLRDRIRSTGPEPVILSSDFGQPSNEDPVENFGRHLERMRTLGFTREEIRRMVCENPKRLLL
jgi:hypothetical protein